MDNSDSRLLHQAFRILRRNYGAPGRDHISIRDVKSNYHYYHQTLLCEIRLVKYNFTEPLVKEFIDYEGKNRRVLIYTVRDRWVQHYLKLSIYPKIIPMIEESVYSYIRGRNNIQAAKNVLKANPQFVLKLDIESFFDSVDMAELFRVLATIGIDDNIMELVTKSLESESKTGLPIGHVLSPMLSNLYLRRVDQQFPKNYARYSDDMFFGIMREFEAQGIIQRVSGLLKDLGLGLNQSKTHLFVNPHWRDLL